LKSVTESCHQWDRLSKKPRFSGGALAVSVLEGGRCGGCASGALSGAVCCGPADAGDAAEPAVELAGDGGPPLCARASPDAQASANATSIEPRTQSRVTESLILLLLPDVTVAPS